MTARPHFAAVLGFTAIMTIAGSTHAADTAPAVPKPIDVKVQPFDLKQVRLLPSIFLDAQQRDRKYLHDLDADRFLHTFRLTAGLPSTAKPYGGWEDPRGELRGHCLGHYLSACALMVAGSGDEELKARGEYIVAELAKCQEAMPKMGYHAGFLSAYPESFFDRVDQCQPVWAPYYTLHKIMAGLLDMYQLCGDKQALEVLEKMAAWLHCRVDKLSHEQMQKALGNEHGGMSEVLANLYAVTGKPEHLQLAQAFNHEFLFGPLSHGEDRLNGLHANTQIPEVMGAARQYVLTGDENMKRIAETFWQSVALKRSYCIGGHSDGEHFFPVDQFAAHLSTDTCETCNTYNMLKLTRCIFQWDPSAARMDFYERGLYNHILASQDPEKGMIVYLMSLKPGHFKTYSTPDDSFWCCSGTGFENHAKYADTIYFHDADSLYVNLFIPSELTWKEKGLVMRQETRFPAEDAVRFAMKCEKPVELALKIRYPLWAQSGMRVLVNGNEEKTSARPGEYLSVKRFWKEGDKVEVCLPMNLRLEELPGNPNTVAVLYGPIVLAGEMGKEGMPSPYARGQTDLNTLPSPPAPVLLCDVKDVIKSIEPVAGQPLHFRTKGIGRPKDVSLIPFYEMHHQRYSVYWQVYNETQWKQKEAELAAAEVKRKAFEARRVDETSVGQQQSETDHKLQGQDTRSGEHAGRRWRDSGSGGWFSYELKVATGAPQVLAVTYWGSDAGNREFDILVDGQKIATEKLMGKHPNEFFTMEYPLPADLLKDKAKITVRFAAHADNMAGGVFDCAVLKAGN